MIANRNALAADDKWAVVLECLERGVRGAHPETVMHRSFERDGRVLTVDGTTYDLEAYDRVFVVGGGNAAGAAAIEFEAIVGAIDDGVIVTDEALGAETITFYEGSHPLPGEEGARGARHAMDLASEAGPDDLVVAIVTGGGSAHLSLPVDDVPLADLRDVTERLLASGATIEEINAVRKHLSQLKGGQLAAAAAPASVCAIVFSDVVGDRLDTISSGPVSPDTTTYADALAVLENRAIDAPESVRRHLERGDAGDVAETPKPGDSVFDTVETHVVANGRTALEAAATCATEHGYETAVLSTRVRGEASEIAKDHVAIAEECALSGEPFETPVVLVSGGETTVTVEGDGTGGPNQEFALSAGIELARFDEEVVQIVVGAIDTDGIDGATDVAGAIVDGDSVDPVVAAEALADNDAYGYFAEHGGVLRTGDTGTNVNDLRVVLLE